MDKVLLFAQDSVYFSSNISPEYFNPNYAYINNSNDSIPVYWFVFGPKNIGVSTKIPEAKPEVVVYPNPAGDYLFVSGLDPADVTHVEIFDAGGLPVLNPDFTTSFVKLDTLKSGSYCIVFYRADKSAVSRVFIKY
jgi:hypothetical protein